MLKIRFQRTGRRNDPSFRIVVGEHTKHPTSGGHTAILGSHHPKTKETIIDAEAVKGWLAKGAQASGTVHNLLVSKGIIDGKKVNVLSKKTPIVKEVEPEEEKTDAPAEPGADAPAEEPAAEAAPEAETPAAEEESPAEEEKKEEAA